MMAEDLREALDGALRLSRALLRPPTAVMRPSWRASTRSGGGC